jgi:hypothetical protein
MYLFFLVTLYLFFLVTLYLLFFFLLRYHKNVLFLCPQSAYLTIMHFALSNKDDIPFQNLLCSQAMRHVYLGWQKTPLHVPRVSQILSLSQKIFWACQHRCFDVVRSFSITQGARSLTFCKLRDCNNNS